MARTYEPIASTTLSSNAATVTFSNITGTLTDLVLVCNVQRATTAENPSLSLRFNSDTGSNYSMTGLYGTGTSALSARQSSQTMMIHNFVALPSAADTFAVFRLSIMSYANTNVYKTALSEAAVVGTGVQRTVGLWRSTSAITSVTITNDGSPTNFSSGSTFSLYGIRAA